MKKNRALLVEPQYIIGGIVCGFCLLLLLTGIRIEYLIPFCAPTELQSSVFVEGSLLSGLKVADGFTSFWSVLISSIILPIVAVLGLDAIGNIIVFIRRQKFITNKLIYDIAVLSVFGVYIILESISLTMSSLNSESETDVFTLVFSVLFSVALIALILAQALRAYIALLFRVYYWKTDVLYTVDRYVDSTKVLLFGISVYLFLMNLFAYWQWTLFSNLLMILAFVLIPLFVIIGLRYCIDGKEYSNRPDKDSDEDCIPKYTYTHPTYSSSNTRSGDTYSKSSNRNTKYYHYYTSLSYRVTRDYDNDLYHDVSYEATFYFKNSSGDEITRTVSGVREYIPGDSISVSEIEYWYDYILDPIEK